MKTIPVEIKLPDGRVIQHEARFWYHGEKRWNTTINVVFPKLTTTLKEWGDQDDAANADESGDADAQVVTAGHGVD